MKDQTPLPPEGDALRNAMRRLGGQLHEQDAVYEDAVCVDGVLEDARPSDHEESSEVDPLDLLIERENAAAKAAVAAAEAERAEQDQRRAERRAKQSRARAERRAAAKARAPRQTMPSAMSDLQLTLEHLHAAAAALYAPYQALAAAVRKAAGAQCADREQDRLKRAEQARQRRVAALETECRRRTRAAIGDQRQLQEAVRRYRALRDTPARWLGPFCEALGWQYMTERETKAAFRARVRRAGSALDAKASRVRGK